MARLFLRHSIVLFYLRIFTTGNPKPIIVGTMVANTLLSAAVLGLTAFQCRPVSLFWTRWDLEHDGHCLLTRSVPLTNLVSSLAMDVWVLVLPAPYLTRLQLPVRQRLSIAVTLASGPASGVIFSILKFIAVDGMESSGNQTGKNEPVHPGPVLFRG
jgi:hypothetical protein